MDCKGVVILAGEVEVYNKQNLIIIDAWDGLCKILLQFPHLIHIVLKAQLFLIKCHAN